MSSEERFIGDEAEYGKKMSKQEMEEYLELALSSDSPEVQFALERASVEKEGIVLPFGRGAFSFCLLSGRSDKQGFVPAVDR